MRLIVVICISFVLAACSNDSSPIPEKISVKPSPKKYHVKETFNVGQNVFVRSLSIDNENNILWVGTSVGVLQVDVKTGNVIKTITRDNGLANEYVFASAVDSNKNVWFGTNGGGVSRLSAKGWETYFPMHGLADYWVYSFADQPGKAMWIGTWAGLSRYDYQSQTFKTYLKELVNEWVYGLALDSKDRLWIGTEGGVNMFDGKQWSVWTHEDGLGAPNDQNLSFSANTGLGTRSRHDLSVMLNGRETYNPNYVFCVAVAPDNTVWAGTWGGGVSFYNGDKWQNLTVTDGLAGNIVYSMDVDLEESWFGTNQGVSRFDGKQWQTIGKDDGLLDSHVYALARDASGQIWAGTRHGVAVIKASP